ncbi:uncharacterized protein J3R85_001452 [Psidium guajava]|nr:uncharacterized protein J3R85_001452 [Psidium guajava]
MDANMDSMTNVVMVGMKAAILTQSKGKAVMTNIVISWTIAAGSIA